ncbi:MAG: hypothetical protein RL757_2236 [Bacteroidota bacterium]|jgi:peptidyl-prolyl cis-trans isomerase D
MLITKIREKGGIFIMIAMVLAILGFIFMDVVTASNRGGGSLFGGTPTTIGSVAGRELTARELDARQSIFPSEDAYRTRQDIWTDFVDESIVLREAEATGLTVTSDELKDLEFEPNKMSNVMMTLLQRGMIPQQIWQQMGQLVKSNSPIEPLFANAPKEAVDKFLTSWNQYERMIIKDKLQTKLSNFVGKSIYTPTWLGDMAMEEMATPADFEFVNARYETIPNDQVTVTDADYEKYLSEFGLMYEKEEETRRVDFISFNIAPSAADSADINGRVSKLFEEWKVAKKDSAYVLLNGGEYPRGMVKKEEIQSETMKEQLASAAIGTILAPYQEGKDMVIAKILDRKTAPDSVKARHILLADVKMADSLRGLLESGRASWDSLNIKFSLDSSVRDAGGALGTFAQGQMVPEFNDLCFYKAQVGKYYTVSTRFGAHIVQVQSFGGKTEARSKIAYLRVPLVPSDKTQKMAEEAALSLATSNRSADAFAKAAQAAGLQVQSSSLLKRNDFMVSPLNGSEGGRSLVKWAFSSDTKVGTVSPTAFAFKGNGDSYVNAYAVAVLKAVLPKGIPSVASAKEDLSIVNAVRNKKKAAVLIEKMASATDLVALAQQIGGKVDTAKAVTFNANFIPNVGSEPQVIASAFATPVGSLSKPIAGNAGVFVIKVTNRATAPSPADRETLRKQMASTTFNAVRSRMVASLKKATKVEDNRSVIFQ